MALPAFVLYLAAAAGGAVVYDMYKKSEASKGASDQVASELIKGKSYVVQMMVNPQSPQWGGVRDLAQASALIKATFEQLGWQFLMNPTPRDPATAAAKLNALQPLEWVFNATWTRNEKAQTMSPSWVGQALPYPLPTV
jgi:hypothetical protein